ncbi:MAG TPA: hypothetical protein VLR26_04035 [Frankiaceae bacterium]|nr:hypothetical protein [Frankiaceae bacterium]
MTSIVSAISRTSSDGALHLLRQDAALLGSLHGGLRASGSVAVSGDAGPPPGAAMHQRLKPGGPTVADVLLAGLPEDGAERVAALIAEGVSRDFAQAYRTSRPAESSLPPDHHGTRGRPLEVRSERASPSGRKLRPPSLALDAALLATSPERRHRREDPLPVTDDIEASRTCSTPEHAVASPGSAEPHGGSGQTPTGSLI